MTSKAGMKSSGSMKSWGCCWWIGASWGVFTFELDDGTGMLPLDEDMMLNMIDRYTSILPVPKNDRMHKVPDIYCWR